MAHPSNEIARFPTWWETRRDRLFRGATLVFGAGVLLVLGAILYEIGGAALPAVREYGFDFFTDRVWDSSRDQYGILPQIWGTMYSSILAIVIATIFGLAVAIVLSQHFLPRPVEQVLKTVIELLAAIPSVVYGLWGIFVVIPALRSFLTELGMEGVSNSMLPAALVLAIMVLPTITAVSRDAIVSVPAKLKEAAFGLGATRWECIFGVVLPTAATGIFGAVVLAFGRALGETMALAMLIGNSNVITFDLLSPGNTLAALLANNFPEATGMQVSALMYAAVVLLLITLVVNMAGAAMLHRANRHHREAHS